MTYPASGAATAVQAVAQAAAAVAGAVAAAAIVAWNPPRGVTSRCHKHGSSAGSRRQGDV